MTSPSQAESVCIFEGDVSRQFSDRPTFERLTQQMLEQAIKARYPSLVIDLARTHLAMPDAVGQGWSFKPFMPLVLDYLALGTPINFSSDGNFGCYLSDTIPRRLRSDVGNLDMKVIEKLVLELPWTVPIGFDDALARYWNTDIASSPRADSGVRNSHWLWLSDSLKNRLHIQGLKQPGLSEPAREALDQIVRWPDRGQRFSHNLPPVYAYSLASTLTEGTSKTVLPSSDILLLHYTQSGLVILLCSAGGAVQSFDSIESFNNHWRARIVDRYVVDTITCNRYEIDGNVFDTQAARVLEQQLADLKAVKLPSGIGVQDLKALYRELSDPARYLRDTPNLSADTAAQLRPLLPEWLKNASLADRMSFQRYSLALASAKKRDQGRARLDDIRTFTADALLARMQQTNRSSPAKVPSRSFHPDDIELTFTLSAGYPGTVGISEKRTMNLTQLAIDNLVSRPSRQLKLSHRLGLALPAWLTPDFITRTGGLIQQVDIGRTYPRYLQQELLDESSQAQAHQRIFAEQISAHLPLEALQNTLNQENGMTRQGLRRVEAVLQLNAEDRRIDGHLVVIRHLAFLREPHARPDIVSNMFLIEAQDVTAGPHVLYRPLYAPALLEFPTRQALLQAVASAGDLQHSVLTWLSDTARPIYANGGFAEPHIVRFFQGDEFSAPEKPDPATLATDGGNDELFQYLGNGKLLEYLYGCNAQALITQADRNSVSNSESRWAVLLKGGSLLFNTLLFPLLRGPALASVWLWSLMASASQDIPALLSDDSATRELAAVDLLVNLAMLVTQLSSIRAPSPVTVSVPIKNQAMRAPASRVIPEQWPAAALPDILEGPVTLPGADTPGATLDFNFTNARARLTPEQRTQLRRMEVPRPTRLPEPIRQGPFTGLYVIDNAWNALVEGHLYRVDTESDGSVTIIDPTTPSRQGPLLRSDGQGTWSLDLRLRLRGGMPPKRIAEQRRLNAQEKVDLINKLGSLTVREADQRRALDVAEQVMTIFERGDTFSPEQRALKRKVVYDVLNDHIQFYMELLDSAPKRASLGIELHPDIIYGCIEHIVNKASRAYSVTKMDYIAIKTALRRFDDHPMPADAILADFEGYLKLYDALADVNDRKIYCLELEDRYLDMLLNMGTRGAQLYERLSQEHPVSKIDATSIKTVQLPVLAMLAIKRSKTDLPESLGRIVLPLREHVLTYASLRSYDVPASEHVQVLESLTEHFGQALDALEGTKAMYAENIHESYFNRLVELVKGLYEEASAKLAAEVKPDPKPSRRQPRRQQPPSAHPGKQLINTRNSGVLIGDLKPAGTSLPIEVVELRSEVDNQVIATYSRHDDVWDVVEVKRPVTVPRTRAIKTIKDDAQKLLEQLDTRLRRAEGYKTRCRHPQEIEEILDNEASRYRTLSAELDRAFTVSGTSPTPADQALSQQLSLAIASLATKGTALRTELSLKLPPTDGNLRYLFEKKLIHVARLGERKALKGTRKDFLQEYAINDVDGFPLWYAHFHYETAETPKAGYSVAHLKTKEQRREHYHSLLAKADSPYAVVNVHRGQIGKFLARDKFLPLAP